MDKIFIGADELLIDSFNLAEKIYLSGFKPDFLIGVWRGGTPIAIAIQEYFEYLNQPTDHCAIKTRLYTDIDQKADSVQVDGLDYVLSTVNKSSKILIVDDVFDSGKSIEAIFNTLSSQLLEQMPEDILVACPWYKPNRNKTKRIPDYYLKTTDQWLVFPHELVGLSMDEITHHKSDLSTFIKPTYPHK